MILVLLLAGAEKLINFAIQSDKITQLGLASLTGKTMRLNMQVPELHIDVVFNEDHLRFEPATNLDGKVFESNASSPYYMTPDCTVNVANPVELLNLIRHPEGNLPIEGDYKVLMQVRELMAGFDPDIVSQLEPIVGVAFASQLTLLLSQLKATFGDTAKHKFHDVAEWANDVTGNGKPDPEVQAEVNDLHQQLLKLRTDVEREQMKRDAIKAEMAELKG